MKTTIVNNVINNDQYIYTNNLSLTENLISSIMARENKMSQLHNRQERDKILTLITTGISKKGNREFSYCEKYDLHARYQDAIID